MTTRLEGGTGQRWAGIIPVAFLMYTIAFMDRINIGLAIPSMAKDLHLGGRGAHVA